MGNVVDFMEYRNNKLSERQFKGAQADRLAQKEEQKRRKRKQALRERKENEQEDFQSFQPIKKSKWEDD